ncbi:peroxisome biogenesis protein 6 [Telopea speciosissima]|uniref:peroxisome biogenesis protein 6 n=1 Tax=Telopea speciosissima TaxID=54955 RepID=UPI001CC44A3D|nr:peroxisome biogenesis protein 6 [Telopea speciosissima]XP_043720573.1 peroxisome biogenesis protein 6 [Telopea speciosissima]
MVERRRPLILCSTKNLLHSVLNSSKITDGDGVEGNRVSDNGNLQSLRLHAGILRCSMDQTEGRGPKEDSLDDSTLVGLSASTLKCLSVTSGSLVIIKNIGTSTQRIGRVVVLDPPDTVAQECQSEINQPSSHAMVVFPSYKFPPNQHVPLDREAAYLSPLLAFNLGLHLSCLKFLVHMGHEILTSMFLVKEDETELKLGENSFVGVEVAPWSHFPRLASHLRISFVKIPECGVLKSFRASSSLEAEERQEMIDSALHNYFTVDRYLARGDIFCIRINWNCNSELCIPCSQRTCENAKDNVIYFKVMAMEPVDVPILRVNCNQTALVLGGSIPAAVPPDLLVCGSKGFVPLQGDTVKSLASILTPPLCPSALSSKFRVAVLLYGLAGCGKRTVVRYVARHLGLHVVEYSCHDLLASSERKTSEALAQAFKTAERYAPTILLLHHFDVFRNISSQDGSDQVGVISEVASVIRKYTDPVTEDEYSYDGENINSGFHVEHSQMTTGHKVLLIVGADSCDGLPPGIRRCFSHEVSMGPLNEEQRVEMLSESMRSLLERLPHTDKKDLIKDIAGQTSGFMPRDIRALIADAGANLISRLNGIIDNAEPRDNSGNISAQFKLIREHATQDLGKEDLTKALERSKKRNASALGTPKVPNVKWEDVGGLEDVKKSILDTVQLPLLHKDLFSSGLRKRSGVLLYGPPGTGKTLLAKAVATECSLNFLSVKGPELINMYIGESEKNIRDIFQKARLARPCVIFFDELDSLAPARGASGDSGGVMDRVVSQMLAEIDGLNDSTQDLFIIGASNRPDLIDPALLRPGRFDKLLYVGVNSDASYRERVLAALTRKFKLHENVSLYSIAKKCPPNFTGADMYALCADAWFHAAQRKVLGTDSDCLHKDDHADLVVVEYDDFIKVLGELSPSLSSAELKRYEKLRDQFEGASK